MADGNTTPAVKDSDFVHTASIGMRGDFYLELGIPRLCVRPETMADYAKQAASWGRSTLAFARHRGDVDEDMPGSLDNVLAAAEFLLQLSVGLEEAATVLASAQEVRHG